MLSFITANTFLNIIAAVEITEMRYQSSGTANAVVYLPLFRKYLYGNWNWTEMNMSQITIFETDTQRGVPEKFSLLKYYSV